MAEEKNEIIFADGLKFELPNENAPDFIKGKISIKVEEFIAFLEQHQNERGWVNLDLKKSKAGKLYVSLNTYVKGQGEDKKKVDRDTPF